MKELQRYSCEGSTIDIGAGLAEHPCGGNLVKYEDYRRVVAALEADLERVTKERDSARAQLLDAAENDRLLQAENAQLKQMVEELEGALKDTVRRASNLSATS